MGSGSVVGIERGTIIWAEIADKVRRSQRKERPALVVSSNEHIASGGDLVVLVISTKFPEPPPARWFLVPHHAFGHPVTGLDQPSVVKTDWPERIPQADVLAVKGRVPARLFKQIINFLKQEIEKRSSPSDGA